MADGWDIQLYSNTLIESQMKETFLKTQHYFPPCFNKTTSLQK